MSSLIHSLMQLAPVLGSPTSAAADSHSSTTVRTDDTASSDARTTPESSTMDVSETTVPEPDAVYSDPEDQYVEAPEHQPQDIEMMYAQQDDETENMQQQHSGHGDVHATPTAFQTPDRKRNMEIDTKTITRPKKTSPSTVTLPEIFAKENSEETQFRPIAASTPVMQPQQAASSSSSVSPRPAAPATPAAPPTQAAAAAAGGASTATRPVAAAPPPAARAARQQTMTVSSALSRDVKTAIDQEKAAFTDETAAARLEARLMALVMDKEREWQDKHGKLGQIMVAQKAEADEKARQSAADVEVLQAALEASIGSMAAGFPAGPSSGLFGGSAGSSLPHLPPAPVLAALSADKQAELARLKKEKENLENENTQLHSQYKSLFDTYSQQRTVIPALKATNEELERGVRAERERFEKLKRHAEDKLEEASGENESLRAAMLRAEKDHETNTLSIRMRLKQRDAEVSELEGSLAQKRKQVSDLKEICAELIAKADANVSDIE